MNLTELTQNPTPEMLAEYTASDFVLVKCDCAVIDIPTRDIYYLQENCHLCGQSIKRLLANGTWQSEAERQNQNLVAYERTAK